VWKKLKKYKDRIYRQDTVQLAIVSLTDRVQIASQIISGIYELHASKISHRDIKNDNILIAEDRTAQNTTYEVRITDYNLSGFFPISESYRKIDYEMCTLHTRAPEYLLDLIYQSNVHFKADIWSIGCILYEVFAGEYLFACKPWNVQEMIKTIVVNNFNPAAELSEEIIKNLEKNMNYELYKIENVKHTNNKIANLENNLKILSKTQEEKELIPKIIHLIKMCLHIDHNNRASAMELYNYDLFENIIDKTVVFENKFSKYLIEFNENIPDTISIDSLSVRNSICSSNELTFKYINNIYSKYYSEIDNDTLQICINYSFKLVLKTVPHLSEIFSVYLTNIEKMNNEPPQLILSKFDTIVNSCIIFTIKIFIHEKVEMTSEIDTNNLVFLFLLNTL
jgi:serine/threonine protein kinase